MKTPSFRRDKKRALMVGASSGLGQTAAVALAEYGADVFIAARRLDALEEAKQLIKANGR